MAYSMRHAGPSWDHLNKFRDMAEIQQRGRWRAVTSVLRYQKHSKLLDAMNLVKPPFRKFAENCAQRLDKFLDDPMSAPRLPGIV